MKFINSLKEAILSLYASLRRFPLTIALSAILTTLLIIINHNQGYLRLATEDLLERLAMIVALGISVSLCIKLIFERNVNINILKKLGAYLLGVAFLILYFFFLLKDFRMVSVSRYIALSLAFYLAFIFIPYFFKRAGFELYVLRLLIRSLITILYSAILFAGIAAILFTIDKLLGIHVSGEFYFDTLMVVMFIFAPVFFLAGIPTQAQQFEVSDFTKLLKILLLYIVMPLITAYSVILYIYFAKIIITHVWPVGLVAHLVLWYMLISTGVVFLITPLNCESKWSKVFSFWFIKLVLPLVVMLFISIGIRVSAYGITENRYFVILMGLWVIGIMIYLNISKKKRNIIIPISLSLIAFLSVFGPWSSYSVSKHSQNSRFESILLKNNMIKEGKIVKAGTGISEEDKREISQILSYFSNSHKLSDVKYLPGNFKLDEMKDLLGFSYDYSRYNEFNRYFSYNLDKIDKAIDIKGYDYLYEIRSYQPQTILSNNKLEVEFDNEHYQVTVLYGKEEIYKKSLLDFVKQTSDKYGQDSGKGLSLAEMTFTDENARVKVQFILQNVNGSRASENDELKVETIDFLMFVDMK